MFLNKIAICSTFAVLNGLVFSVEISATEPKLEKDHVNQQKTISPNDIDHPDNYLDTKIAQLKNNIEFQVIGSRIIAKFSHRNELGHPVELNKLAAKLGYKSFNWVSYVEQDPHGITNNNGDVVSAPYNDPPFGGYQYEAADLLPFYWDMTACDRCNPEHQYNNPRFTNKFELIFEDTPSDRRLKGIESIKFITHLVGVKSYNLYTNKARWDVIDSFRWQLTNNNDGQGRVSLTEKGFDLNRLSPFMAIEMEADGATLPKSINRGNSELKIVDQ